MTMRLALVALLATAAAPPAKYVVPDRIGALQRSPMKGGLDPARYVALAHYVDPALLGTLDLFVRDLGVSAADDLASTAQALHRMTGVAGDGTPVAADKGCPGLVGRIDRGTMGSRAVLTASLFDVQDGHNVKIRLSYVSPDGDAGFLPAVDAARRVIFHCATNGPAPAAV